MQAIADLCVGRDGAENWPSTERSIHGPHSFTAARILELHGQVETRRSRRSREELCSECRRQVICLRYLKSESPNRHHPCKPSRTSQACTQSIHADQSSICSSSYQSLSSRNVRDHLLTIGTPTRTAESQSFTIPSAACSVSWHETNISHAKATTSVRESGQQIGLGRRRSQLSLDLITRRGQGWKQA